MRELSSFASAATIGAPSSSLETPVREGIVQGTINQTSTSNGEIALWFFLGVAVTVIAYLVISIIRKKLKKQ